MSKSAEAFRTISEVESEIDVAKHVLRFWEGKFAQVKPMKRGGGRRYYRPEDVDLLRGIRQLLKDDCYTIKGVQKLLKEYGVEYVKEFGRDPNALNLEDGPKIPDLAEETARSAAEQKNTTARKSKSLPTTGRKSIHARPSKAKAINPKNDLAKEDRLVLQSILRDLEACKQLLEDVGQAKRPLSK